MLILVRNVRVIHLQRVLLMLNVVFAWVLVASKVSDLRLSFLIKRILDLGSQAHEFER